MFNKNELDKYKYIEKEDIQLVINSEILTF